jgi:hypothetical protein
MTTLFNETPHLELWDRNLHYIGCLAHAISKKIHYYRGKTNMHGIKDVHSIMTTEYDNQNTFVVAMMQLGMWQKKKEEEL